jgi:predicted RNase H-like HicB family nuclease
MKYMVFLEPVPEAGFEGFYYAHIPTLGLTTHGQGLEGALAAARDLAEVWVTERVQRGETVPREARTLIGEVELTDALFSP